MKTEKLQLKHLVPYLPYGLLMFENHIDVFGLIDKGLAIDSNKIGGTNE